MRRQSIQRALLFVCLGFPLHLSAQGPEAAKPDSSSMAGLVRKAVANYKTREAQLENYTYLAHFVLTAFDRHGKPTGQTTFTDEIIMLEGAPYQRTILHNGSPLSPEQEKQQQMLLEAEATARRAGYNKQPVHLPRLAPIAQLPDEFRLRRRGKQLIDGRLVQVIEALPINAKAPASADREYARHFKLKLWIDADEAQIVRLESEVVSSLALDQDRFEISADLKSSDVKTLHFEYARGTTTAMEWTKVNGEVWLPKWSSWKTPKETVSGLMSTQPESPLSFPDQHTATYSDYKKFHVETRVVPK
jgi:hypothetical protein